MAKNLAGGLSEMSIPALANTFGTGLYYKHAKGVFTDIDQIDWSFVEINGTVANFDLSPKAGDDYFNFEFEGYLYIDRPGTYQFETLSDEGSRLTIDNKMVVDNDGIHGLAIQTGAPVSLSQGLHVINCKYFEHSGAETLTVSYKGPDTDNIMIPIPDIALTSTPTPSEEEEGESESESEEETEGEGGSEEENESEGEGNAGNEVVIGIEKTITASIFPNPLGPTDRLAISLQTSKARQTHINLIDMMGRSHFERVWDRSMPSEIEIIPYQALSPGMYIIIIRQDKISIIEKLVIRN